MRRLLAALRFLTCAPVPRAWTGGETALGSSLPAFPVVGLLAGGVLAAYTYGLQRVLPPLPVAALVVAGLVAVSGALHLEGVADTADGFLSARSRDLALEIMRDSRAGAMAVIAVVLLIVVKVALVTAVPSAHLWRIVLLTPLAGRSALVVNMAVLPYARPDGLASVFSASLEGLARRGLTLAWAVAVFLASAWLLSGWAGITGGVVALLLCLAFAAVCWRRIGGYTGDTLGAACELAELALVATAAVWA